MRELNRATGFISLLIGGVLLTLLWSPWKLGRTAPVDDCTHYADSNLGTDGNGSLAQPWNQVNGHLNELAAGDVLCLRGTGNAAAPQIYSEALDLAGVADGTSAQPITVQAFPGDYATIQNSDPVLTIRGADYWIFSDLGFDHLMAASDAIRIRDQAGHNTIKNCTLQNGTRDGIDISSGSHFNRIEACTIGNFNWTTADAHCIVLDPDTDGTIIHGNTISNCSGDGVQLYAGDSTQESQYAVGVEITENEFTRGTIPRAENAIDVKGSVDLLVQGNTISGYLDNKAIVLQKGSQGTWLEGNTISGSERGLEVRGEDGKDHENITILRNVFFDITGQYAVKFDEVTGVAFLHNTIADTAGNAIRVEEEGVFGAPAANVFRNNLTYNAGSAYTTGSAIFQGTVDHNGWFDTGTDPEFSDPTDTTGTGDPGFSAAGAGDYTLLGSSVAIDQGIDLGSPFSGSAPDLGAYEYQGAGFEVVSAPGSAAIPAGEAATYTLTLTPLGGYSDSVTLSFEASAPFLTSHLTPTRVTLPGSATLVLTDTHPTGPLLPGLFHSLPITASGAGYTQTITITLLVGGDSQYLPGILHHVP